MVGSFYRVLAPVLSALPRAGRVDAGARPGLGGPDPG
jgi:hypothetical protein